MSQELNRKDQRKRIAITIAVVSSVVLLVLVVSVPIFFWQISTGSNSYDDDGLPVGDMLPQLFGLNTKTGASDSSDPFERGSRYFLQATMADSGGDQKAAIGFYQQALDQFRQYPGLNSYYACLSMQKLGDDYVALRDFKEAEQWYRRMIDNASKMNSGKHRLMATTYSSLGRLYSNTRRHKDSLEAFQSALAVDLAATTPKSLMIGRDYWWIGNEQYQLGQGTQALKSLNDARSICEGRLPGTLLGEIALTQAKCASSLKDYPQAALFVDQSIKYFGTHDDTYGYYSARLWKVYALQQLGKRAEADDLALTSFPSDEKINSHLHVLGTLWGDYATYHMSRGNYAVAESLWRRQLSHDEKLRDKDDPTHLPVLEELARCLAQEDKLNDSTDIYSRIMKMFDDNHRLPPKTVLEGAIKAFAAANMTAQLKSARTELQRISNSGN